MWLAMARPLRIEYPGAYYHVLARGHRKDLIFYSVRDRHEFLHRLHETAEKYNIRIHAYVLMNNHYHLLIETLIGNLAKGMHYLNASYANWFRIKHNLVGSVFQGRYKSILIEKDAYFLELSAYIHLNPLRAGITESYDAFPWSSFHAYCQTEKSQFPYTHEILSLVGGTKSYKKFVAARINKPYEKETIYGANCILGGEDFKLMVLSKLSNERQYPEGAEREIIELRKLKKVMEEDVRRTIIELFGVEKRQLFEKTRGNLFRKLYLFGLKKYTDMSLKTIGKQVGMDYAAVSELVRRCVKECETKKDIRNKVMLFETVLKTKGAGSDLNIKEMNSFAT